MRHSGLSHISSSWMDGAPPLFFTKSSLLSGQHVESSLISFTSLDITELLKMDRQCQVDINLGIQGRLALIWYEMDMKNVTRGEGEKYIGLLMPLAKCWGRKVASRVMGSFAQLGEGDVQIVPGPVRADVLLRVTIQVNAPLGGKHLAIYFQQR